VKILAGVTDNTESERQHNEVTALNRINKCFDADR